MQNIKQIKGEPLETLKKFRKKSHEAEKSLRVPNKSKISKMRTLLLWNGFVFHVRGFGCVQNQVLSTYFKSAQCVQKMDHLESEIDKKTSHCNCPAFFLQEKCAE